jgi:predicted nuclease of predicted toxin-antitoxin system
MRLLLDQNLDRNAAQLLRDIGHDALNTREVGLRIAEDNEILEYAAKNSRVIATLDSVFHALLVTRGLSGPSTILIRVQSPTAAKVCELVHSVCLRYETQLLSGCMFTVDGESARVQKLPLRSSRR